VISNKKERKKTKMKHLRSDRNIQANGAVIFIVSGEEQLLNIFPRDQLVRVMQVGRVVVPLLRDHETITEMMLSTNETKQYK
jgi:hypothetical protein